MPCPPWPPTRNRKSFSTRLLRGQRHSLRTQTRRQGLPPRGSVSVFFSWQIPRARRLAHLFERSHVSRQRLAIGKLIGPVGALGVEKIQQAGGAALVGILADVARLRGLVHVAAFIKLDNLLARAQALIGVYNVRQHLLRSLGCELLVLRNDMPGTRDLALVAVEKGKLNVEEKRSGVG